ncbi:MAG: ornithine carbamoyltransferase [Rhodospirillales bacterium]|nr:ornithine carbamoyltransferase [Rhodospirillales bacterium]
MAPKHFLDLDRLDGQTLQQILALGADYKRGEWPTGPHPLAGKTLAMIFEKPSTRTRVSFEVGMLQLGGHAIILSNSDSQLGRGETIADTARVLSRYADAIMIRTNKPEKLLELARHASVPVINGLTDASHPCQVMADIMTFQERRGPLEGRVVAWTGDGNNVACSWIQATVHFGFEMRLACPPELAPPAAVLAWARDNGGRVSVTTNPVEAVRGADAVITDTWVSMGQTDKGRHALLAPYQVNDALMGQAHPEAVFMHCLPAHRGEEVTDSVMDGPQSVVWDEAENRLHAQKGILTWCMS